MSIYNQSLLKPPDEEEIYPYRRVWRSLAAELVILAGVTGTAFFAFGLLKLRVSAALVPAINAGLVALPVGLWLVFSVWPERRVPQPRQHLIVVFLITALAANAVAIPFIDGVFQTEKWLPLAGAISRIVGYTFTVGIVQEVTKYAVVRFVTWPNFFRARLDGVAYCVASALGYALVLNLRFILGQSGVAPDVVALLVFNNVAVNLAASLIVSYGLAEVRFDNPTPFLMTVTVAFAALLNGIVIPLRSGLTNAAFVLSSGTTEAQSLLGLLTAAFSLRSNAPKPILGFGLSAGMLLVFGVIAAFLFSNAERQAREAAASREA
jgi:RsiW-degrading membrane proteinase PrsW (M82 family)